VSERQTESLAPASCETIRHPAFGMRLIAPAIAALCVACGPSSGPGSVAPAPRDLVYVANEASGVVSVVDPVSGSVQVVDLKAMGYGDNPRPHQVVVEPDGSRWYASLIGANRVLAFDRSNRVVDSATFETPGLMVLGRSGDLWVGRSMSAVNAPPRVGRIETDGFDIEELEVFTPLPHALAMDPEGRWAYTGSMHERTLVEIDTKTGRAELTRLSDSETRANGLAHYGISPDGRTLVATSDQAGTILAFDASAPPTLRLIREVPVGPQPWTPAFSSDGREVWVTVLGADEVVVVDTRSWSVSGTVRHPAIAEPHGLVVSPDGSRVYVASRNTSGEYRGTRFGANAGTLVAIDTRTREVVGVWEIPHYGAGVSMAGGR